MTGSLSRPPKWVGRLRRLSSRALSPISALLLLCSMPVPAEAGGRVVSVRVWPAPEYTRVTIESPQPIEYALFSVAVPKRLVLDLEGVELNPELDALPTRIGGDDAFVAAARVARFKPNVVRVVFDLRTEVKPQAFALRPIGDYAHRLVIDIYPLQPADPVLALLEKLEREERALEAAAASPSAQTGETGSRSAQPDLARPPSAGGPQPADAQRQAKPPSGKGRKGSGTRLVTIAIDAGHGGEDPGARGKFGTHEKDVTLAIARKLKTLIAAHANLRAMLTREGDYFVPLVERVSKARRARVDLFVSIHADAFIKPHARGSSVFALSERGATSAAARWLANKENEADLIGGVNLDVPDPTVKQVLLDLSQTAAISDSIKLGRSVLASLGDLNTLHRPRVEQAAFAVLKAPDIPSILVETAFISNPIEERKLRDAAYQAKVAGAILEGVKAYLAKNPPLARDQLVRNP